MASKPVTTITRIAVMITNLRLVLPRAGVSARTGLNGIFIERLISTPMSGSSRGSVVREEGGILGERLISTPGAGASRFRDSYTSFAISLAVVYRSLIRLESAFVLAQGSSGILEPGFV